MNRIYVTGHRNPDTDSIAAAISYAALRNALGNRDYVAAHLGHISDETKRLLDRFGFPEPVTISNVRTQVRDLDFDTPPALNSSVTMDRAWHIMRDQDISAMPIINEDGTLYGMLSAGDIAAYSMRTISDRHVDALPLFNLLSVIEGRILNDGAEQVDRVSGVVTIALPQSCDNLLFSDPDSIILCGNQPDMIRRALDIGVQCIILCQTDVDPAWLENAGKTCVISTPLDASRVARLVYQAIPISRPCNTEDLVSFHLDDYIDDVREVVLESRYRCYPVLDENEKVVGTLSRYHLLRPRRKRVVLVDHNEMAQAVPGLEQAEILEIIDHHRLADIQTTQPIRVRNEPVGSTTTIITNMYQEHGVMPSPNMAGLMAGAILSDTVMFKSPTCTKRDIAMAERLARIANVSLKELGNLLFAASSAGDKSADELCFTDFKEFHIADHYLGVGQVTSLDSAAVLERKDELLAVIRQINEDPAIHGCLLFRPLPKHLDERAVCEALRPEKDVDCITSGSLASVFSGDGQGYPPCTAQACLELLDYYGFEPTGRRAVVVGRSLVIGRPAAMLLLNRNATVTTMYSTVTRAEFQKNSSWNTLT